MGIVSFVSNCSPVEASVTTYRPAIAKSVPKGRFGETPTAKSKVTGSLVEAWDAWRAEVNFATRFVADAPSLDITGNDPLNQRGSGGGA
jgi:hypothetical protein